MSDLRTRIAAVHQAHHLRIDPNHPAYGYCMCGYNPDADEDDFWWVAHAKHVADAVIRELLPKREGKWGWMDGTVSTNPQTGNPIKLEIEPGEVIPLSVEDARNVALALLAAVTDWEADNE